MFVDSQWPILHLHLRGTPTAAECDGIVERFEVWLDRHDAFGLVWHVWHLDEAALSSDGDSARRLRVWAVANRGRVAGPCIGIATIARSRRQRDTLAAVIVPGSPYVFGCPGEVFLATREGEIWLRSRLARRPDRRIHDLSIPS